MLILTEEQTMLREAARDFLDERAPVSHLRELRDRGNSDGFSRALWAEMAELGWAGIVVPEDQGGLDYGYTGLGVILEETGRTLTPSPLLSTALLGATALRMAGDSGLEALPSIADGSAIWALASEESARHQPGGIQAEAAQDGQGYRISGTKHAVIDGHAAGTLIVSARMAADNDTLGLFQVSADDPGVGIRSESLLDHHRDARIELNAAAAQALMIGGETPVHLERLMDLGRVGQSAELLGIAQQVFDMTLDYLRNRRQFGIAIASFQALQHRAAHLYGEIEMLRSAVLRALHACDGPEDDLPFHASLCKAKACSVAGLACNEAVQMHGGIGMTDEFDLGFYLKRSRALTQTLGDEYFHLDRFAKLRNY